MVGSASAMSAQVDSLDVMTGGHYAAPPIRIVTMESSISRADRGEAMF